VPGRGTTIEVRFPHAIEIDATRDDGRATAGLAPPAGAAS
jgi:hypothetical protein